MNKKIDKWLVWSFALIAFLIAARALFSTYAPYKCLEDAWEAGDLISLVSTITLGYVAVRQTQRANKISERLKDIENNRYMLEVRPFMMVTDWKAYDLKFDKSVSHPGKLNIQIGPHKDYESALGIGLQLQNTTNSYMTATYSGGHSDKVKWSNAATNQPNRKLCLLAGESKEIVFYANHDYIESLEGEFITVEFILENRFAEIYQESFHLIITALSNKCIHKNEEWYCSIAVQDFKIGKFTKNTDGKQILIMEE